jgi:small subunit ribosomal protein S18
MNQIDRFRPLISFIYRTPIRPIHLSSIRSIEWSDIDEYTNKVNTSVFLTTDVYEKDGNIVCIFNFIDMIFYLIDEWIQYESRRNERLRKTREQFLLGPPKRKSVTSSNKDSSTCPSSSSFTKAEPDIQYDPNDDRPKQINDPYLPSPHKCIFCVHKLKIDFRNTKLLSQFISPQTGFVFNQRTTGLCYFKQVELEKAILKARRFHLMPYKWKETVYLDDPRLFNPYDNTLKKVVNSEKEKYGH